MHYVKLYSAPGHGTRPGTTLEKGMKSHKDIQPATARSLRSRFVSVKVEENERGEPRIVLSGPDVYAAGFRPGDIIDGIVQEGLISLLRLD